MRCAQERLRQNLADRACDDRLLKGSIDIPVCVGAFLPQAGMPVVPCSVTGRNACGTLNMNLINRDTGYAVRALRYMAQRPDEVLSVTDLHTALDLPRPYLRTILQRLAHAGILSSHRGQHGGFALNKRPETILLTDVIELFQGEVNLCECMFQGEACTNRATCTLRATIKEVEEMVVNKLSSTTIATLGPLS